jgi:predicted AlkP superfamily pyrophosphatase or phosphodiesterase
VRAPFPRGPIGVVACALAVAALAGPPPERADAQVGDVSPVPLDAFGRGVERSNAEDRAQSLAPSPRLVVALLFDQYRDDYLDRFRPVFGKDGFRRLVEGGARFRDCTISYAATLTGPAHATWLSGTNPATHGVVGNGWYDRAQDRWLPAADDPAVRSVGLPGGQGGEPASPRWMKAQTVADVLRARTGGLARVIAISDKARSAVLPAGRRPHGAYWLDWESGRMQTSTHYRNTLPPWVVAHNEARHAALERARREPWTRALPEGSYLGTRVADPADVFPHAVAAGADERPSDIDLSLHPVTLNTLFDFAEAAVENERLGADAVPDLLVLSVSITDGVGHRYGPDSPEVLDLAHRADARLAEFLRHLDRTVGRGRWVLSLTSDHGVASAAAVAREFEVAPGDSVGGLSGTDVGAWVDRVLAAGLSAAGSPRAASLRRWTLSVGSGLVSFDDSVLALAGVTRERAARVVADSAGTNPWFVTGFTAEDLRTERRTGLLARQVALGFDPARSGDVVLVPRPYVYFGRSRTFRASHGSPYRYDTHVPLVFYGWGVRAGTHWDPVSTVDIAPTLAALLGIDAPAQSEGRVLAEAFASARASGR